MKWPDKKQAEKFLLRYGAPCVFVFASFLVTFALWSIVKPLSSPLFLVAITLSAWWGGFRSGLFATILSGLTIDYVFISPTYQFVGHLDDLLRLSVFVCEGTVLSWLIAARRTAGEEIKNSREQLRALSLYQQTLREAEQKRISLEIHDELGQALTGMKLEVHWLKRRLAEPPRPETPQIVAERLAGLSDQIDQTITSVRRISTELRPAILDDFGLLAAIEWQAREFERKTDVPCVLRSEVEDIELDTESTTAVFRIFQETLTNITRHAGASSVSVVFKSLGDRIMMRVADDGCGIASDRMKHGRSLGILGMRERSRLIGGELNIFEASPTGTVVELIFPAAGRAD